MIIARLDSLFRGNPFTVIPAQAGIVPSGAPCLRGRIGRPPNGVDVAAGLPSRKFRHAECMRHPRGQLTPNRAVYAPDRGL